VRVVVELASKLLQLRLNHPDRHTLIRLIDGLRVELREQAGHGAHSSEATAETYQTVRLAERRHSRVADRSWEHGLSSGGHVLDAVPHRRCLAEWRHASAEQCFPVPDEIPAQNSL
jgi:hypothetical protein